LLIAYIVGINAYLIVEIKLTGHRGADDRDLVYVDANIIVLGIPIEGYTELEQRV